MNNLTSRERVLKKIKQALIEPVPVPFPQAEARQNVLIRSSEEDVFTFAENFTQLQGKFIYALSKEELVQQLNELVKLKGLTKIYCREQAVVNMLSQYGFNYSFCPDLHSCDVAITGCEKLVARTGSILMSSAQESGRTVSVYAPIHICIAYSTQLVYDISDGLQTIQQEYVSLPSMITLATGPSRTADIEKTLVVGVHGPKEVFCFLLEK